LASICRLPWDLHHATKIHEALNLNNFKFNIWKKFNSISDLPFIWLRHVDARARNDLPLDVVIVGARIDNQNLVAGELHELLHAYTFVQNAVVPLDGRSAPVLDLAVHALDYQILARKRRVHLKSFEFIEKNEKLQD